MGDPAGIGLEITLRAWLERSDKGLDPFVVFGDKDVLAAARAHARPCRSHRGRRRAERSAGGIRRRAACVAQPASGRRPRRAIGDPANAAGIVHAIEAATASVVRGEASAIVTDPIAKHVASRAPTFPSRPHGVSRRARRAAPSGQALPAR